MENKLRIALLVNRDPTAKGVILTELRFFNTIFSGHDDYEIYLVVTSAHYQRIAINMQKHFTFPTRIITIENFDKRIILDKFHTVITWTMACNFYGGAVSPRIIEVYKLISYFTNEVKRPVLIRLPDSEIQVVDYHRAISLRKSNDPNDFFTKKNRDYIDDIMSVPEWNYDNCYWLANGRKDIFDWIVESVNDKPREPFRVSTREKIMENSIYISDDIFFMIKNNYEKFSKLTPYTSSKTLGYVGFFTTLNKKRAKALTKIWSQNEYNIPIDILGKGTDEIKIIGKYPNVNITEGTVKGDDYWNFLNSHLAYVFVGKGNSTNRYINKTIYDCVIARTPIILFKPCDKNHVGMISDEMYFSTEKQLFDIYNKLLDPSFRARIVEDQKNDVFSRLSDSTLDLSFIHRPELPHIHSDECVKIGENVFSTRVTSLKLF